MHWTRQLSCDRDFLLSFIKIGFKPCKESLTELVSISIYLVISYDPPGQMLWRDLKGLYQLSHFYQSRNPMIAVRADSHEWLLLKPDRHSYRSL